MSWMFQGCRGLITLSLANWNSSQVTNMSHMFDMGFSGVPPKLTDLNLSGFRTDSVTNMDRIFYNCGSLTSLDVSKFNTAKVTNMSYMFFSCSKVAALDVSKFDTSKVTDMSYMFAGCSKVAVLYVNNFDTIKVTDMNYMFAGCKILPSLDVSHFNTANVTDMGGMFVNCLVSLDVSSFDTAQVTNMSYMFYGCHSTNLDVSHFDTAQVSSMSYMFYNYHSTNLDVSNFDTSQVTNMSGMFYGCHDLLSLDVSKFDTSKVTDMSTMFAGCSSLTSLNLSSFNTSKVTNINYMLNQCRKLSHLVLGPNIQFMGVYGSDTNLVAAPNDSQGFPEADSPQISRSENWQEIKNDSDISDRSNLIGSPMTVDELTKRYAGQNPGGIHTYVWEPYYRGLRFVTVPQQLQFQNWSIYKAGKVPLQKPLSFTIEDTRTDADRATKQINLQAQADPWRKKADNQLASTNWPILTKNNQALNTGTAQTIYQGLAPVLKYDPKNLNYSINLPTDSLQTEIAKGVTKLGACRTTLHYTLQDGPASPSTTAPAIKVGH
ncbi:BspA family leucine-rich repeat surface protein [Bombilactobacillus apium]|nr:BspA family leucine-rich repeat surface protein [Bombilactobacillus apium]